MNCAAFLKNIRCLKEYGLTHFGVDCVVVKTQNKFSVQKNRVMASCYGEAFPTRLYGNEAWF